MAHRELDANAHIQAHAMHVRTLARVEQFRSAVASPAFAYARARMICGSWVVTAYCRDANSPTGVLSAGSCDDPLATQILYAAGRTSPLSPTEGLNKSGAIAA